MATEGVHHETVLEATGTKARLARVYAEGLMAAAASAGQIDVVGDELESVVANVLGDAKIVAFLESSAISRTAKLPVLGAAFSKTSSELFQKFIGVLNQNNRLGLLKAVNVAFSQMRDEAAGRVRVRVTAPVSLSDNQIGSLKGTLAAALKADPVLDIRVNPELLGGLVVQVGDTVYDTSVRTRLNNLRTHLMASASNV